MINKHPTIPQVIVHLGGILPLAILTYRYISGDLWVNPILELEHQTGRLALFFLVLSLASTPARLITGRGEFVHRRKALGLYGALYAFIHVLIFTTLDYGLDLGLIFAELTRRSYIIVGAVALLILIALAITSNRYWRQKLGPNWKRLHRLVYILSPLVILHFGMVVKGNLFLLQGDYSLPLIYAVVVILLLVLRIPGIKTAILEFRLKNQSRRSSD